MWNEFKRFAIKGNVIDLATGVVIGTAFGKIVTSLVNDIIMPIVGLLIGGIDFSKLIFPLPNGAEDIKIGLFIQTIVNFMIIAFSIFMMVRLIERFKRKEEEKPAELVIDRQEELLSEIRDLLKERSKQL
ncbi:large conductance mechanosensitive channel protein MscL [Bacillus canaveralius]|uniref:Large-conductance mechanosensitive channel n=1 Tax=Bacillus canaveralius TaxID=1403243 RepID=A0A2N5GH33_9BACI|nr:MULTISPECIES: large-conductance mechanosensitive channel protein MscL [Bacillus]PLR80044.1 large conductance mechanosensitive channel protein MscL [Bacillus canaveralius]PLR87071.1 large conductance mechanosensitive channel protein MscL [Bacillus sp. V33-4]PLR94926.1 large conductance mechanosensitive channel protein MscL [Bacillus canaveralius]RSK50664.1 large-conductance mechanosensitive channel protein MscL [Bacillus canaveralius]